MPHNLLHQSTDTCSESQNGIHRGLIVPFRVGVFNPSVMLRDKSSGEKELLMGTILQENLGNFAAMFDYQRVV